MKNKSPKSDAYKLMEKLNDFDLALLDGITPELMDNALTNAGLNIDELAKQINNAITKQLKPPKKIPSTTYGVKYKAKFKLVAPLLQERDAILKQIKNDLKWVWTII